MVKQYTANIYNWLKTKLNSTASNSKMNGTQSAGSSNLIARADHVHPVDTSRAPNNHATSATTYGVGSSSNYGHVKVDNTPTDSSTNAVASGGVKTVLDTKQNEVETQAKIVSFTNKDRINIERLLQFVDDYEPPLRYVINAQSLPVKHYELELKGGKGIIGSSSSCGNYMTFGSLSNADNKLAIDNSANPNHKLFLGVMLYENGEAQTSNTSTITFKFLDGTVIGTNNLTLGTCSANESMKNYKGYVEDWSSQDIVWDPGIYYVYAETTINGSVIRSNILSVFVKDTNNKLSYNQWSAGEYTENTNGFESTGTLIITKKYSHIGENSLYCINNTDGTKYVGTNPSMQVTPGKTYTFSVKVYTPNSPCSILIVTNSWNTGVIYVPASDTPQSVSVSYTAGSNDSNIYCRCNVSAGAYVYLDDLSLVEG